MFACRNLNLSYKGNKILKDIHFHIPEGTVFCIPLPSPIVVSV